MIKMANIFKNVTYGKFWGSIALILVLFQAISIILGKFFMPFAKIVSAYQTIWMFILLAILTYLIFRLVLGMKSFDKKSLFIMFVAIALISTVIVYLFGAQMPGIFNGTVIQVQIASILPI